ncbi:isochorismatase family protein [Aureisphaera galaxeae]|uniref:isochorismatase family protein n=1 Tax=Aureisphaera galaxeae TaxID=1538023 RepID=UPI00234FE29D|nr:isochorismatase family protein [Aureisphaera galaxeae]MDC8004328.1 isochorismatase family protein [Aureisphaera galaxeae]
MTTKRNLKKVSLAVIALLIMSLGYAQKPGENYIPKDPKFDNLLTSENTVLLVIDFQEEMMGTVRNIERDVLTNNTQAIIKTAQVFNIPIIETTIGVGIGANESTLTEFKDLMPNLKNIDRISLNAWQNREVIHAVEKTGRKKLIITGLWTSGCPTYTALDAIQAGYEVYILTDVMGDATIDAHNRAIERMVQAGAIPFTWEGAGAEILRAYIHPNAMQSDKVEGGFVGIMKEHFYPFAGKY